jgi:hypothetical protein
MPRPGNRLFCRHGEGNDIRDGYRPSSSRSQASLGFRRHGGPTDEHWLLLVISRTVNVASEPTRPDRHGVSPRYVVSVSSAQARRLAMSQWAPSPHSSSVSPIISPLNVTKYFPLPTVLPWASCRLAERFEYGGALKGSCSVRGNDQQRSQPIHASGGIFERPSGAISAARGLRGAPVRWSVEGDDHLEKLVARPDVVPGLECGKLFGLGELRFVRQGELPANLVSGRIL